MLGLLIPLLFLLPQNHERCDFQLEGKGCHILIPRKPAIGKPWVWRARFPQYHSEIDHVLLGKGFHIAYTDVSDMFGCAEAVKQGNAFYRVVVDKYHLNEVCALEGVSRGGLFIYNWAAANPDKVACIYADTPVCDIKSWPGRGRSEVWAKCLNSYNLTEAQAQEFKGNPMDILAPLARANIPILHIVTENDQIVPPSENSYILKKRYEELGGAIDIISIQEGTKESSGHHFPLTEEHIARASDFIFKHACGLPHGNEYFVLRGGLDRCMEKFRKNKSGRVAFLGGSITHNPGWRDLVSQELQRRFPGTEFEFINAGLPSTGSTPGAFRLVRDVFLQGKVDLLFEEAAVNDDTNHRTALEQLRGMEGIVRHAKILNPDIDIVLLHFVDPEKMKTYQAGKVPTVIQQHEKVAEYYHIPSINLAKEVTDRIEAKEFDWKNDFRNLHPSPFGQRVYYRSIRRLFDAQGGKSQPMPTEPLDPFSYFNARYEPISRATLMNGWRLEPSWNPSDGKGVRQGFVNVPMLVSNTPGSILSLKFKGRAVGIFVVAGPDAGKIKHSVDQGPWKETDLFTTWSQGLHLPWAHVLESQLPEGEHELRLEVSDTKNLKSKGFAVRIAHFLINE